MLLVYLFNLFNRYIENDDSYQRSNKLNKLTKDIGNICSDYEMTFQYGVNCSGKSN
jgi:hypothetical protein